MIIKEANQVRERKQSETMWQGYNPSQLNLNNIMEIKVGVSRDREEPELFKNLYGEN